MTEGNKNKEESGSVERRLRTESTLQEKQSATGTRNKQKTERQTGREGVTTACSGNAESCGVVSADGW